MLAHEQQVFYFGCWGRSGHFLHTPNGHTVRCRWADSTTPTPWKLRELDAERGKEVVVPADPRQPQGAWRLSHRTGPDNVMWTALGCHDRTGDHRFGSCSVFIAEGEHDEAAMRAIAQKHFPVVWARIHEEPPNAA